MNALSIGMGTFIGVVVFFLGLIFFLIAYFTKKTVKNQTIDLTSITQEIIHEIERSTDNNIERLEKQKEEIEKKLNEMKEVQQAVEKMYAHMIEENRVHTKKIVPKFTNIDDKKKQIYELHHAGYSPEKISQKLKIHKGIIETIINFEEYETEAK